MRFPRAVLVSLTLLFFPIGALLSAQVAPDLLGKPWPSQWITGPGEPQRDPFVFHFRKVLDLPQAPAHFLVHVSADSQFLLHVNQQRVGTGPARGDLPHWRFETYDLAPYLHAGRNTLAATVWGFGVRAAYAQISDRAGFVLQADAAADRAADSNERWEVEEDKGLTTPEPKPEVSDFYGAEPGERIEAQSFDWQWDAEPTTTNNDPDRPTAWKKAVAIDNPALRGSQMQSTNWQLVPDPLPSMAMELISAGKTVRTSGLEITAFPDKPFTVPPQSKVSVLADVGHLTTAYPELTVSGGQGASIHQTYAEALYDGKNQKGNRNEIAGKQIAGLADDFFPDGPTRTFMPLAWRAWRYLQLDIATGNESLKVESLRAWFTAFPFEERGFFHSDDPNLSDIWQIGWRTARLDAHDTYMDTPYWERLQYIGDTRIQALLSYTIAGDDRLARQAIQSFNDSRIPDGITQSRYPSNSSQFIPTFSLLWIGMIHDFWLYRGDQDFVRQQLPGTRTVLAWFRQHQRPDGLLDKLPWWPFVDWAKDFDAGVPPQDENGGSVPITLQYVEALRNAAELESVMGDARQAAEYQSAAARAVRAVRNLCWNKQYGLVADTPAQTHYSQHANILAAWLDVIPSPQQKTVLAKILASEQNPIQPGSAKTEPLPPISKSTYYFRFYLARALDHAGMGDGYLPLLQPWRDMTALGLTTWAETPEPTRSDSHAWSAHPNFDLLTIVAGIRPKTSGFTQVTIQPHLGTLHHVAGAVPTPKGEIKVEYTRTNAGVEAVIVLPASVSGNLIWDKKIYNLHPGQQELTLPQK